MASACTNLPVGAFPFTLTFDVEGYSFPIRLSFVSDACHVSVRPPYQPGCPFMLNGFNRTDLGIQLDAYYTVDQMRRLFQHATAITVDDPLLGLLDAEEDIRLILTGDKNTVVLDWNNEDDVRVAQDKFGAM